MQNLGSLLVAGAVLLAVGCSSDSGSSSTNPPATAGATTSASAAETTAPVGSGGTNTTEAPATVQPSDPTSASAPGDGGATINVPEDQPTIRPPSTRPRRVTSC